MGRVNLSACDAQYPIETMISKKVAVIILNSSVHDLGYMDKRDIGECLILQEIFDGSRSFRERVADSDRMPIFARTSFQLIKPGKDG